MYNETYFLDENTALQAVQAGDTRSDSVVIVLHGLAVSKEVHITEITRLNSEGFFSVAFDAPHHGSREDGWLEVLRKLDRREQQQMMLSCVFQQAQEISVIVKHFKDLGKKVCVTGISMGAYTTFALLRAEHKPDLFAPFLGNPDFRAGRYSALSPNIPEISGPADHLDEVFPASLFIVNATKDHIVSALGARNFYEKLRRIYKTKPNNLEYFEYTNSEHLMLPEDWFDAWDRFINRLKREKF